MGRSSSVRLPQEKSPEGDQHEEMGIFSFDQQRQQLVYREFMIEGVVPRSVKPAGSSSAPRRGCVREW